MRHRPRPAGAAIARYLAAARSPASRAAVVLAAR
jgi:hypothetical protein